MVEESVVGRVGRLGAAEVSRGDGVAAMAVGEGAVDGVVLDSAETVPTLSHGFGGDGMVFQLSRWGREKAVGDS